MRQPVAGSGQRRRDSQGPGQGELADVGPGRPPVDHVTGDRDQMPDDRDQIPGDGEQIPGDPEQDLGDPESVARAICLRLLTDRARSRSELARALAKRGVPADPAAAVLDRFAEVGLIDDASFARQWVASRHAGKGLAGRALRTELRRKGVSDEDAAEAVEQIDDDSERLAARALVDRRLRSLRGVPAEAQVRRLTGMLARKGYGGGTAYAVVKEALAERRDVDPAAAEASAGLDGAFD